MAMKMNIKLRSDILSKSLVIENLLGGILSVILNFTEEKSKSKSLGHTANALSFKAKTDLLLDLKQLKQHEYNDLITFMEIRNKLMHNLDVDTITKAADSTKKINKLIEKDNDLAKKYLATNNLTYQEEILKTAFQGLYDRIVSFSKGILKNIIEESKNEQSMRDEIIQTRFLIDIEQFFRSSIRTVSKTSEKYSDEELNQMQNLFLIFFYKQISEKYPNVFRNIENLKTSSTRKRS